MNQRKDEDNLSKIVSELQKENRSLAKKLSDLGLLLERMNFEDYFAYLNNPRKLLLMNFAIGLVRGLGAAIGATVLLGVLLMLLKQMVLLNLPLIGGFIANLVEMVNSQIKQ